MAARGAETDGDAQNYGALVSRTSDRERHWMDEREKTKTIVVRDEM